MAGNMAEWTVSAMGADCRVARGGDCYHTGSIDPPGYRGGCPPQGYGQYGSRSTLYISLE